MPLVIIGTVIIAFLVLAGMPFGDDDPEVRGDETLTAVARPTATIAEVPPSQQPAPVGMPPPRVGTQMPPLVPQPGAPGTPIPTGTLQPVQPPPGTQPPPTDTSARMEPPAMTQPVPPPTTATRPATPPPTATQPPPARETPRPTPPPERREPTPPPPQTREPEPREREREPEPEPSGISEAEAVSAVRRYLVVSNYYEIDEDCVRVRSGGRAPGGWTLTAWNACAEGGGTRMLGRWFIDATTRDIRRR